MKLFQQAVSLAAMTVLGAGMLAISVTAQARENDNQRLDWLVEQLELSADQSTAISHLLEAHREQMESIDWRDESGRPSAEARDQVRAARQALHEEIDAVLTEDQQNEFAGLLESRRQHGRRDRRLGYFMATIDSLDISEDQRQAIHTFIRDQRAQGRIQREEFRSELETILTDEQLAELDAMRDKRTSRRHRGRHSG